MNGTDLSQRRCVICRRRLAQEPLADVFIRPLGLFVIHQDCNGNPPNPQRAHEEREQRRQQQ